MVGVLGESCVGIGRERNVMHVVVEEDGGDDIALWDAKVDVSVGREGVLEEDLLFSAAKVVAQKFGDCARKGRDKDFGFEHGQVDSVEGFGEV